MGIEASGAIAEAIAAHRDWIAAEVLASSLSDGPLDDARATEDLAIEGTPVRISVRPA